MYAKSVRSGVFEKWVDDEFANVERADSEPRIELRLKVLNAQPARYSEGMIVYADGTNWNPDGSSGKGVYVYNGSAWVKL